MLLLDTILLRPYVFVFFLVYLAGCTLHLGLKRALVFGIAGYALAWVSEYSSIHTGFPYGFYYYIEETRGREIWVLGVPLMDSASYVFLAYASYSLAIVLISPLRRSGRFLQVLETRKIRSSGLARVLAAVLFVYLDIIIDPVALQGERWFLGKLYGYPEEGMYFGVPLSNFAGWFLTGFAMIASLQAIDGFFGSRGRDWHGRPSAWGSLIGPLLYAGVILFNLAVTFWIGEYTMAWTGVFLVLLPALLVFATVKTRLASGASDEAIAAHQNDFPEETVLPAGLS